MKIPKDRFEAWAQSVSPPEESYSLNKVAVTSGLSRSSVFLQARKGYVETSVVVAYSRALGLPPLEQMLTFQELALYGDPAVPSQAEVLSQITPEAFMEELLTRLRGRRQAPDLGVLPIPYGMKRWMDCYSLYGQMDSLTKNLALSHRDRLSERINRNKFSIGELACAIEHLGMVPRFGLVVSGILTLEEVGYPEDLREQALNGADTTEIIDALGNSLRWLTRTVQAKELEHDFYRNIS